MIHSTEPNKSGASKLTTLLESKSCAGHYRCLVATFLDTASRVVEGLLAGEEYVLDKLMRKELEGEAKGPVWDADYLDLQF